MTAASRLPTEPWTLASLDVERILSACAKGDPDALAVVRLVLQGPHRRLLADNLAAILPPPHPLMAAACEAAGVTLTDSPKEA